jgi:hypothetical protein
MASTSRSEERSEIAFFDVSTTVPTRVGQGRVILEFAAILVSPRTLVELNFYSTPVRPANLSLIESYNTRCNVASAPTFVDIADRVYDILQGLSLSLSLSLKTHALLWGEFFLKKKN